MGKIYEREYIIEITGDEQTRRIEADSFEERGGWLVFYRRPATGGTGLEYWRIRLDCVLSMETNR